MNALRLCPRCGRQLVRRAQGFIVCRGCSRPPNACDCPRQLVNLYDYENEDQEVPA